ncbi:MAG TPA: FAD-dependent oxidoreductase, partial [Streptosporangiaceae bacterium]|nr:FAD-dependent oxidoreductase [Streptosporangiaceae bacterium]
MIATDGTLPATADAVIIGAGIVGAATAASLAAGGRRVCVIDRAGPLAGTTAAGEGNLLVSDKLPGPELALALRSLALWREFAASDDGGEPRGAGFEFEPKGGVVVARSVADLAALRDLAAQQRSAGVEVAGLDETSLGDYEPHLAAGLAGGAWYPQDCQVQPMSAAMAYLDLARRGGHLVLARAEATALEPASPGSAPVLVTGAGRISAPVV